MFLSSPSYVETSVSIDYLFLEVLGGPYEDRLVWFDFVISLSLSLSICLCHRRVVPGIYKVGTCLIPTATFRYSCSGNDAGI